MEVLISSHNSSESPNRVLPLEVRLLTPRTDDADARAAPPPPWRPLHAPAEERRGNGASARTAAPRSDGGVAARDDDYDDVARDYSFTSATVGSGPAGGDAAASVGGTEDSKTMVSQSLLVSVMGQ